LLIVYMRICDSIAILLFWLGLVTVRYVRYRIMLTAPCSVSASSTVLL
jgi:hypothetical protein